VVVAALATAVAEAQCLAETAAADPVMVAADKAVVAREGATAEVMLVTVVEASAAPAERAA